MNNLISSIPSVSRDTKVNMAFGAFFAVTLLTGGAASVPLVLASAGSNLLGAELVKGGLNWLNRRAETPTA